MANAATWLASPRSLRSHLPIALSGTTYFVHFLSLGFASFPLQTHLRQLLEPSSASLVASVTPIAACLTYFLFRFAESRLWTRSPQRLLAIVAVFVAGLQALLGWRLHQVAGETSYLAPALEVAACLLLLGCAHSCCMTLLNHIGVATMGAYAFTVRAAGSAGYMVAVILMGSLWADSQTVAENHLFIASAISVLHATVASLGYLAYRRFASQDPSYPGATHPSSIGIIGKTKNDGVMAASDARSSNHATSPLAWWGLLALVWMVAMCEMSYSLYSHEFLTGLYGNFGYFIFAGAIALEIGLLLGMPWLPSIRSRLLFVGPLGWILLLVGCLTALSGMLPMGFLAMALALNCPFQISANEHAHKLDSSILGVASMTLAQSLGYMSATLVSALVSDSQTGPLHLWMCMVPVATIALVLALWKMSLTKSQATPNVMSEQA